jgi:hypothetical protein
MALQKMQATFILRWAITAREGSSRLGVLSSSPSLFLVDMLQGSFSTSWFLFLHVAHLFGVLLSTLHFVSFSLPS